LLQIRPGVFEGSDLEVHEDLSRKMKFSVVFILFGFISTSAFRVWQIKMGNRDPWLGVAGILASYLPGLSYYSYWQGQYNIFLTEVSKKYRDRIRDDQLEKFKQEGPAGNTFKE
jgi:hypothetical protein